MISLVVGGTKGIGKEISNKLISDGHTVFTVSRGSLRQKKHLKIDITKDNFSEIKKKIKTLNNLVFAQRYRGDNEYKHLDVSVSASIKLIEFLKNNFIKNKSSIVFLSSVATSHVVTEQSVYYHASRGAIESVMKYYSVLLGKKGIRANCVSPDFLIKKENRKFFKKNNKLVNNIRKLTPLDRVGHSSDLANLVSFLCSKKSSFITGQTIKVDGGLTLMNQRSFLQKK